MVLEAKQEVSNAPANPENRVEVVLSFILQHSKVLLMRKDSIAAGIIGPAIFVGGPP
jgi:hypothetical protein